MSARSVRGVDLRVHEAMIVYIIVRSRGRTRKVQQYAWAKGSRRMHAVSVGLSRTGSS